jgi:hypothetical protein
LWASDEPSSVLAGALPPPAPINGNRRGSGAAESVWASEFWVRASSACERVLGVRPAGVKVPEERKEPSVGGMRDGRGLIVVVVCYKVLV